MGRDSGDYLTCHKCSCYEIDTVSQCAGVESGIMNCSKHNFCISCYPKAFDKIKETFSDVEYVKKYGNRYFEYDGLNGSSTDEEILAKMSEDGFEVGLMEHYAEEGVPTDLCPMCNEGVRDPYEILEYLLKKAGMTREEVQKEMNSL